MTAETSPITEGSRSASTATASSEPAAGGGAPGSAAGSDHLAAIDKSELRSLLLRNWMTHDAMWFAHAVDQLGIETANRLNRSAVRGMAAVEIKRVRKWLGLERVSTLEDVREVFEAARALAIPDFIEFTWTWSPDCTRVTFEITRCFAFEGVSALGVADTYECGIYERVNGWLEALGVVFAVAPDVVHCTMHRTGTCAREYVLEPPSP